jgi:hypothetical protein
MVLRLVEDDTAGPLSRFKDSEKPPIQVRVEFVGDALACRGKWRQRLTPGVGIVGRLQDVVPTKHDILNHLHPACTDIERRNERRGGEYSTRAKESQKPGEQAPTVVAETP